MGIDDLANNYPVLYHMASEGSWKGIREHGLLSTSRLLDLYGIVGQERVAIEDRHRSETVTISHERYGTAHIRDQKPMSDSGLARALHDGLSPADWYRILNSKVFFWTNTHRLSKLLCARAYRSSPHDVLSLDTRDVVGAYAARVRLCPMNSGATKPFPHPRGRDTFLPISEYPWSEWVRRRGVEEAVVEVAFEEGVPDVERYVHRVVRMQEERELEVLFQR